ncbi:hypothetical protein [Luteimonas salinilitoris]|uniref:Uncharacterized protein n=1 Tax=Luteimonas salinilitoris TaxID=3237697 RepID=A0ABV4HN69_9GAMM
MLDVPAASLQAQADSTRALVLVTADGAAFDGADLAPDSDGSGDDLRRALRLGTGPDE